MARARKTAARPRGPAVFVVQAPGDGMADCAFTDRAAAEAHRRELDRVARACANPFNPCSPEQYPGSPEEHSSDSGAGFWEALTALDLRLPKKGQDWGAWWETVCAETTAEQRVPLWDALDNWHYFDVIEVPLEG